MKKNSLPTIIIIALLLPRFLYAQNSGDLDSYIKHLKEDKAGPLKETGYLTAGSDFLYAQEYFDSKNYSSAEWYFLQAVTKQKDNAFANYQLAISLIRQNDSNKKQQAQEYLQAAFKINPSMEERYKMEFPGDIKTNTPDIKKPKDIKNPADIKNPTDITINDVKKPGLDAYIAGLKLSGAAGGKETSMGTAGYEALYGIRYYEANEYDKAATSFMLSLQWDATNPYINYLLAVSLAALGKDEDAKPYLQKASAKDTSLLQRFDKDANTAKANWQKVLDSKKIITMSVPKPTYGGALLIGNYTCHELVWNGPGKSPAYTPQYRGYFALKSDGTYRWVDNGVSGNYSYDAKSGNIKWLSGYFKTYGAKPGQYILKQTSAQVTITFSDSNSWECDCKKK